MTLESAEPAVRPRGTWYLLVAATWLAAIAIIITIVVSIVHVVEDGVTPIGPGGVPIPDAGVTIYASANPVSRDCLLTSESGRTLQADGLSFDLSATFDGTSLHALASSPDGLLPGLYTVRCPGVSRSSQLWYGDRFPLGSIVIRSALAGVLGLAGLVLLVVLLVMRHNSRSRLRTWRLMAMSPYAGPPVWYPPAPPSSPPPYQPPPVGEPPPYQPPPAGEIPPHQQQPSDDSRPSDGPPAS